MVFSLIGTVLRFEAALMLVPLAVSLLYGGEDAFVFVYSALITLLVSVAFSMIRPKDKKMRLRDGFMTSALSWTLISVFGALPFYLCGSFDRVIDCLFEATSGFTTTGATVLAQPELLPRGVLFWRSMSHWIGGMGVLMFILALMPEMSASSVNLIKVESSGPAPGKMLPKVRETATYLYLIYVSLTAMVVVSLLLAGMPVFDAFSHAFSIAGTGGFSTRAISIGAFNSPAVVYISALFLLLFGVNYTLYFHLIRKEFKVALLNEELLLYAAVVGGGMLVVFLNILPHFDSAVLALRNSVFQVSSIITSTCLFTTDYNLWPTFSKLVLMFLMMTGCCAGSTGGGIKLVRVLLLVKGVHGEVHKLLHPNVVKPIIVNKKVIDDKTISKVYLFFFVYIAMLVAAVLVVSFDDFDIVTTVTAVAAMLSNAGVGLGAVGPTGDYAAFSTLSKAVLSLCMLAGRLELFPVILMFAPSTWKKAL